MQALGFFMKLILFTMVLVLTLASEIGPPLHDNANKASKKPKTTSKKNDKSKKKKPKSGLYYLQDYQ
jgi:lipopolysaccharide export LptBFGC system permease protein LptF